MKAVVIPLTTLAFAATGVLALPQEAQAAKRYRVLICDKSVRSSANTGTLVGALVGAGVGNAVAGNGAKAEGSIVGAGLGAATGHQIAKKDARRTCRYVYRYR